MGRYNRKANCFRVGRTRGCRANYVVTFPILDSTEGTGKNRKCHCLPYHNLSGKERDDREKKQWRMNGRVLAYVVEYRVVSVCRSSGMEQHKSRPCLSDIASPYLVWKGWLWYRHSADMGGEASDKKGDW